LIIKSNQKKMSILIMRRGNNNDANATTDSSHSIFGPFINRWIEESLIDGDTSRDHKEENEGSKEHRKVKGRELLKPIKPVKMLVDFLEIDQAFHLIADVPGVAKEDIDIQIEEDILILKAERKVSFHESENGGKVHFAERSHGKAERRFKLPKEVDYEKIEAKFDKGVLTLHLPKKPEEGQKTKKIQIIEG
jgi:HSP20 family molecular chaperone IbpA